MRTSLVAALTAVMSLASCMGMQTDEGRSRSASPSAETVSPTPPSSGEPVGRITECRGLHVPRVELDTNLNRQRGLLTVNYTIDAHNRSFTISYDDPSCRENPEVRKLLRNVGV
jgi:hypothetical protein